MIQEKNMYRYFILKVDNYSQKSSLPTTSWEFGLLPRHEADAPAWIERYCLMSVSWYE